MIMRCGFGVGEDELSQQIPEADNELARLLDFTLQETVLRTGIPSHRCVSSLTSDRQTRVAQARSVLEGNRDRIFNNSLAREGAAAGEGETKVKVGAAGEGATREGKKTGGSGGDDGNGDNNGGSNSGGNSGGNSAGSGNDGGGAGRRGGQVTMIGAMLRATEEDGTTPSMSHGEIKDELATLRGAGHETTSNTLCWTLMLLCRNAAPMERLRAEVDAKVKGAAPTFEEIATLDYAHQVVYETLRLYPTVPTFPRLAARNTTLGGYDVPRGSLVFVQQSAMNRNPNVWPDPTVFRPERFDKLPELKPSKPVGVPGGGQPFGFVPFGAGPRTCVGQRLAMLEAVQILAAVVKRFDVCLAQPGEKVGEYADITLGPKKGLFVRMRERRRRKEDGV